MGLTALLVQAVYGLLILAFAMSRVLWLSDILLFLTGAALMVVFSTVTSLVQLIAPNEMRGRVMSIYMVAFRGGMPLGSLVSGYLATLHRRADGHRHQRRALVVVAVILPGRSHAKPRQCSEGARRRQTELECIKLRCFSDTHESAGIRDWRLRRRLCTRRSPPDEVARLEQQGKRVYAGSYRGITAMGQYERPPKAGREDSPRRQDVQGRAPREHRDRHGHRDRGTAPRSRPAHLDEDGDVDDRRRADDVDRGNRTDVPAPSGPLPHTHAGGVPAGECRRSSDLEIAGRADAIVCRGRSRKLQTLLNRVVIADDDKRRRDPSRAVAGHDRQACQGSIGGRGRSPNRGVRRRRPRHATRPRSQPDASELDLSAEGGTWKLHLRFTTAIRN